MKKKIERCDGCKGTNIEQQVIFMVDPNNIPTTLKIDDATFDDYYFCLDCGDECHVEEVDS